MEINTVDYRITASHLNAFDWYLRSESAELQDLLDNINRVYKPTSEAQARGKCFEEIVNRCLRTKEFITNDYKAVFTERFNDLSVEYDFVFPNKIINEVVDYLQRLGVHTQQAFVSKNIKSSDGKLVELYGFVDYLGLDCIIDLKTTSSYTFPKYRNNWQKEVYMCCCDLDDFEFVCVEFPKQATDLYPADADYFCEKYNIYDNEPASLAYQLRLFGDFLEDHKHLITDKKIFGGENETTEKPITEIKIIEINSEVQK